MTRIPLWRSVGGGLLGLTVALALVAVAVPGQHLVSDEDAQILLDGVLAIVAVTMVGAAYYTLRAGGCLPGPTCQIPAAGQAGRAGGREPEASPAGDA